MFGSGLPRWFELAKRFDKFRPSEEFGRQSEAAAPRRGHNARGNRVVINPPGPTKIKNPPLGGFLGFGEVGLDEGRCPTNATKRAFGPP